MVICFLLAWFQTEERQADRHDGENTLHHSFISGFLFILQVGKVSLRRIASVTAPISATHIYTRHTQIFGPGAHPSRPMAVLSRKAARSCSALRPWVHNPCAPVKPLGFTLAIGLAITHLDALPWNANGALRKPKT